MAEITQASKPLYDAFMSYSHAADNELAPVLQRHLQSFAKPFWQLRSLRIFRDDTTLVLTPQLWPEIRKALDASRYFVLLASERAAQSRWVQQEVSHWLSTRGADTLLIVKTDGRIEWDDATNDFDWGLTTALPPVLKGAFKSEPKWEDVAALIHPSDLDMRNPVLRKTVASLYSAVTGRPLDAVIGDDVRQHRRTRIAIGATALAALLGVSGYGWSEIENRNQLEAEKRRTEREVAERLSSQARYWAEQAREYTDRGDAGLAMNLILEDLEPDETQVQPRPWTPETHFALWGALHSNHERQIMRVNGEANAVDVSRKGQYLAATDRNVHLFDQGSRLRRFSLTHEGPVVTARFTRDGERVVSASRDRRARIWSLATRTAIEMAHQDEVVAAVLDADEKRVATASKDKTAAIWDAASGSRLQTLQHDSELVGLAWEPAGGIVFTITRSALRAFDAGTGRQLWIKAMPEGSRLRSLRVSRDGKRVATTQDRGPATLWNATDGGPIGQLAHGRSAVHAVEFSPTDDIVASTGADQRFVVWDSITGVPIYSQIDHTNIVSGAAFSDDGSRLMTWSWDRTARIYSACDGRPLAILRGHNQDIRSGMFTPDGCGVLTGSGDATARLWDLIERPGQSVLSTQACTPGQPRAAGQRCRSQEAFATLRRHYLHAAFSRDGAYAGVAGLDRIARVFDTATSRVVAEMPPQTQPIRSVAFDETGRILFAAQGEFAGDQPAVVRLWDWRAGREVLEGGIAHPAPVVDVRPSPDGARLLTASADGMARIFDAKSGALQLAVQTPAHARCQGKPCRLNSARWSPQGDRIVTASNGYDACVWNVAGKTGELKEWVTCVKHDHVVYSANWNSAGTHIVTASGDQTAVVWNAASGEPLRRFFGDSFDFRSAEFFDRDRQLVTAHNDYSIRFWHAALGREMARVQHRQAHITSASMDAGGRRLLTSAADGTARIWPLQDMEALADSARQNLQRCLSSRQREEFNLNTRPQPDWCTGKLFSVGNERPQSKSQAAVGR